METKIYLVNNKYKSFVTLSKSLFLINLMCDAEKQPTDLNIEKNNLSDPILMNNSVCLK